jgi:adenylate kinase family enzyme
MVLLGYRRVMARRIAVMGSSCAGKTTLAGQLAERLGVPHVELDALHHGPNWTEATAEELKAKLEATLAPLDGWIADGNYMGNALFPYTIHAHIGRKWTWPAAFEGRNVVRLRSPREVEAWLAAQARDSS